MDVARGKKLADYWVRHSDKKLVFEKVDERVERMAEGKGAKSVDSMVSCWV